MTTKGWKPALALGLCAALMGAAPASAQMANSAAMDALHQALNLSPEQEGGWRSYRATVSAPNRAQERRRAAARMFPTLNAVQRMDLVEAEMKQDLVDFDRQSRALKTFYATLSPQQQRIFDQRTLPPAQGQRGGQ
ncbi:MAG: Spy/CpxP family protein refolding chaperone [Sphingomonadales bacterium]|nr:Spy/CpxP family protein refolding chaperone [Sphingomonadales bacterium]MDE2171305.1 Spy/CpxP family protein refolding chaperone [Sphingomonadales bacterium]